ncbi:hypothetical protein OSB04_001642 [Centaurea solstitialis]|uniref:Uncharacterized protein n=1 Tax=Centaurea solstitialis TaxID=347529 RepID=A0AA38U1Y3_9ASTR|nr:hypothetical protein OSB04_001642 [Centaurea solstitialis]
MTKRKLPHAGEEVIPDEEYDESLESGSLVQTDAPQQFLDLPQVIQLQWDHTTIFKLFLKETFQRIFQRGSIHIWSLAVKYEISHIEPERRRIAYINDRETSSATKGSERIKRRFIKVKDVRPYHHGEHTFSEFFCLIYGDVGLEEFSFKEADLDSIDLENITFLIDYLQVPFSATDSSSAGLKCSRSIYVTPSTSLESPQVNLLPLVLSLDLIRQYFLFCPISSPEEGIVYPNRKGERRFMGYREISHFYNGTLIYILNGLKHRMNKSEMSGAQWENRLIKFKDGVKRIEKKLKEKMIYRRSHFYPLQTFFVFFIKYFISSPINFVFHSYMFMIKFVYIFLLFGFTVWVAWDLTVNSKEKGGLDIGSLRAQDLALLAKKAIVALHGEVDSFIGNNLIKDKRSTLSKINNSSTFLTREISEIGSSRCLSKLLGGRSSKENEYGFDFFMELESKGNGGCREQFGFMSSSFSSLKKNSGWIWSLESFGVFKLASLRKTFDDLTYEGENSLRTGIVK